MSLSSQARTLAQRGAEFRRGVFGVDATGARFLARMEDQPDHSRTFSYYITGRQSEILDPNLTFKDSLDLIIRVDKTEPYCDPTIGKLIRLIAIQPDGTDLLVRIEQIPPSAVAAEWSLVCKNFV